MSQLRAFLLGDGPAPLASQLEMQLGIFDSLSDLRFETADDFAAVAAEFAERWATCAY